MAGARTGGGQRSWESAHLPGGAEGSTLPTSQPTFGPDQLVRVEPIGTFDDHDGNVREGAHEGAVDLSRPGSRQIRVPSCSSYKLCSTVHSAQCTVHSAQCTGRDVSRKSGVSCCTVCQSVMGFAHDMICFVMAVADGSMASADEFRHADLTHRPLSARAISPSPGTLMPLATRSMHLPSNPPSHTPTQCLSFIGIP